MAAQLRPVAQATQLRQQLQAGQAMGYPAASVWWRVLWPQLLPRLALPLLAVWAYGLSVVDMALVLGPTRPPTLAQLAWSWLLDADAAVNAQGAAAVELEHREARQRPLLVWQARQVPGCVDRAAGRGKGLQQLQVGLCAAGRDEQQRGGKEKFRRQGHGDSPASLRMPVDLC